MHTSSAVLQQKREALAKQAAQVAALRQSRGKSQRSHSVETMVVQRGNVLLRQYEALDPRLKQEIEQVFERWQVTPKFLEKPEPLMVVPQYVHTDQGYVNLAEMIGRILQFEPPSAQGAAWRQLRSYPEPLNADDICNQAREFADYLEHVFPQLTDILLQYESYEVVEDEFQRTLDLLRNLRENERYFVRRIGAVTTFLPRNQPLYAFSCFVVVPALMASEVHVRAPMAMRYFFADMVDALKINTFFPNVHVSYEGREDFVRKRTCTLRDKKTGLERPVTDAVIFTGTMENADAMRRQFDPSVLFISNGAGHNPIVVGPLADVDKAAESALKVQLYNQGQDCANPNAILVHASVYEAFLKKLYRGIDAISIGPYVDRQNRVGPISNVRDLRKIQNLFVENHQWIDPYTPGIIRTLEGIIEPTIIRKPLREGGNFVEQFAPVFFVQYYEDDKELLSYFEDPRYAQNAMYITLYGESEIVNSLVDRRGDSTALLHDESTIIRNTDLHAPGVERGTQPYGGYGRGASCYSIYGRIVVKPTLPQREFHEQLVEPFLQREAAVLLEVSVAPNISKSALKGTIPLYQDRPKRSALRPDTTRLSLCSTEQQHWSDAAAETMIARDPERQQFVCSAGISPSGVVHSGNLRDVLTTMPVVEALQERGKDASFLFFWDDYDPLRKVPLHFSSTFSQFLGMPLSAVPDPLGEYASFAERHMREFEYSLAVLGIETDIRSQTEQYASGYYDERVLTALRQRRTIADIVLSFMSEKGKQGRGIDESLFAETYFPVQVYSRFTGKNTTRVLEFDGQSHLTYRCLDTGEIDTVNLLTDRIAKLSWKADWAMRWAQESVAYEPAGSDHATLGGSYDVSSAICTRVFGRPAPLFVEYGFISLRGLGGKMSSSHGMVVSPRTLLEFYEPALLKWLYFRRDPEQAFSLAFDMEIYRQYDEFDQEVANYKTLTPSRQVALARSLGDTPLSQKVVKLRQLVGLGRSVEWKVDRVEKLLENKGIAYDRTVLQARLQRARYWAEHESAVEDCTLLPVPNEDHLNALLPEEREHLLILRKRLDNRFSIEEWEELLYSIPKQLDLSTEENKERQKTFFRNVYLALFNKDHGPRLSTYLWGSDLQHVRSLLPQ